MILLTPDESEKLRLLDKLFTSLSVADLTEMSEREEIIARLKGDHGSQYLARQIIDQHNQAQAEIMTLRSEIAMLKGDFQTLLRCLNKGMGDSTVAGEFYNLKYKHGVY